MTSGSDGICSLGIQVNLLSICEAKIAALGVVPVHAALGVAHFLCFRELALACVQQLSEVFFDQTFAWHALLFSRRESSLSVAAKRLSLFGVSAGSSARAFGDSIFRSPFLATSSRSNVWLPIP